MPTIRLGNVSPLRAFAPDPGVNSTDTEPLGLPNEADGTVTTVRLPPDRTPREAMLEVEDLLQYHVGEDAPVWVESPSPFHQEMLLEYARAKGGEPEAGRPKSWVSLADVNAKTSHEAAEKALAVTEKENEEIFAKNPGLKKEAEKIRAAARKREGSNGTRNRHAGFPDADMMELGRMLRRSWDGFHIDGPTALKTDAGDDFQSDVMGGGTPGTTGTSTAVAATSLTNTGAAWTANAFVGQIVSTGAVYGIVLSNTATVLTVDRWYVPGAPGGVAAATPAVGIYVVTGGGPAYWMALSNNATAPVVGDTTLAGELVAAGGGLLRALATYAHTAGANSYTLTKAFTANASDVPPKTIEKVGVLNAQNGGRLVFSSEITNGTEPVLNAGDQLTITESIAI